MQQLLSEMDVESNEQYYKLVNNVTDHIFPIIGRITVMRLYFILVKKKIKTTREQQPRRKECK